jgi:hypothetical protein
MVRHVPHYCLVLKITKSAFFFDLAFNQVAIKLAAFYIDLSIHLDVAYKIFLSG